MIFGICIGALMLLIASAYASQDGRLNQRRDAVERLIAKQRAECPAPKRWIEVDALADDAGRKSKTVCK